MAASAAAAATRESSRREGTDRPRRNRPAPARGRRAAPGRRARARRRSTRGAPKREVPLRAQKRRPDDLADPRRKSCWRQSRRPWRERTGRKGPGPTGRRSQIQRSARSANASSAIPTLAASHAGEAEAMRVRCRGGRRARETRRQAPRQDDRDRRLDAAGLQQFAHSVTRITPFGAASPPRANGRDAKRGSSTCTRRL